MTVEHRRILGASAGVAAKPRWAPSTRWPSTRVC